MTTLKPARTPSGQIVGWMFWCPGCAIWHVFDARWTVTGAETESPSATPSLLTHGNRAANVKRCHLFLREGRIAFLGDCEHELAGQTVPLQEEPELRSSVDARSREPEAGT